MEKHKKALEGLMNFYRENTGVAEAKRLEAAAAEKEFNRNFEHIKHEVIWPIIVDIGNELTHYSHDFQVTEEERYTDATAVYHPANITFSIYPAFLKDYERRPESAPYVSFVADPYARMVSVSVSTMLPGTGGVVGEHGRYSIDKITSEFVEKEIVEVLKNIPIFHNQK